MATRRRGGPAPVARNMRNQARANETSRSSPSAKAASPRGRAKGTGVAPQPAWAGHTVSRLEAAQRGMDEEDILLDSYLSSLHLARKHTPKDGACLFRAVAEHVYHTQALHGVVREECVEYLQEHHKDFAAFICVNGRPYDDYVNKMRKLTTWGGEVELQALSNRYRANFEIYQLGEQVMKIDNGFNNTYQLCFSHGNHYDIVYPESTMSALAMCQSLVYELVGQVVRQRSEESDESAAAAARDDGWEYRNVELEGWIEESRKQEMEDILLAQTLNGNGSHYGGGEADAEGEFQRVGKKKSGKAPVVSNTHSFPALRPKAVAVAVAPVESKVQGRRGPSSVEHVFRAVVEEESPWVLKRRQQEEERKRQLEQEQEQRNEEERKRQLEQEQNSNPATEISAAASPAGAQRQEKAHRPNSTRGGRRPQDRSLGPSERVAQSLPSAAPANASMPSLAASTVASSSTAAPAPSPSNKWGAKKDWKQHLESAAPPRKPAKDGPSRSPATAATDISGSASAAATSSALSGKSSSRRPSPALGSGKANTGAWAGPGLPHANNGPIGRRAASHPPRQPSPPPQPDSSASPLPSTEPSSGHSGPPQSEPAASASPTPVAPSRTWAALVKTQKPAQPGITGKKIATSTDTTGTPQPSREIPTGADSQLLGHPATIADDDDDDDVQPSPAGQAVGNKRPTESVEEGADQRTSSPSSSDHPENLGRGQEAAVDAPAVCAPLGQMPLVSTTTSSTNGTAAGERAHYSPSIPHYLGHSTVPEDKEAAAALFSFGAFSHAPVKGRSSSPKVVEGVDLEGLVDLGITFGDFGAKVASAAAPDSGNGLAASTTLDEERSDENITAREEQIAPPQGELSNGHDKRNSRSAENDTPPPSDLRPASDSQPSANHQQLKNNSSSPALVSSKSTAKSGYGERLRSGRGGRHASSYNGHHNHHAPRGNVATTGSFYPPVAFPQASYPPPHTYPPPHGPSSPHAYPPFVYPEYSVYYHPPPPYEFGPPGYGTYPPPYDMPSYGMAPHYEGSFDGYAEGYEYAATSYSAAHPYEAYEQDETSHKMPQ